MLTRAVSWINGIVAVPQVGDVYEATVKSIMPFGAFVEFLPGKQGLVHISEISWKRLETLEGIVHEGDVMKVKLIGTDPKSGKFKLSRKILLPKPERQDRQIRHRIINICLVTKYMLNWNFRDIEQEDSRHHHCHVFRKSDLKDLKKTIIC